MEKNGRRKRVNRSASEKSSLLEAYRRSGKTQADFCKSEDLSSTSLGRWISEESKKNKIDSSSKKERFIELKTSPLNNEASSRNVKGEFSLKINIFSLIQLSYERGAR